MSATISTAHLGSTYIDQLRHEVAQITSFRQETVWSRNCRGVKHGRCSAQDNFLREAANHHGEWARSETHQHKKAGCELSSQPARLWLEIQISDL
jgi:hypothetical protein